MIKVNVSGIESNIKRLQHLQRNLPDILRRSCERLAEEGVRIAQAGFDAAEYDGTKDNYVYSTSWENDRILIIAEGTTVAFIEFGTGINYPDDHPQASEYGAIRGQYGRQLGSNPTWRYIGEPGTNGEALVETPRGTVIRTRGNPAGKVMYQTGKELHEMVQRIVREEMEK